MICTQKVKKGLRKKNFRFIYLTNGNVCVVDEEEYEYLNQWRWSSYDGYANRSDHGKKFIMHRVIMNTPKGMETDHINHNTLDNRKSNLRIVTIAQNQHNQKLNIKNKSGYKGVSLHKKRNKWGADITVNKKKIRLGYFSKINDAVEAYDRAAKKYFGKYALTNKKMKEAMDQLI